VEILHDLSSMPATWSQHSYGGCVGTLGNLLSTHLPNSCTEHGVNDLFGRSEINLPLAESGIDRGHLVVVPGSSLDETVEEAIMAAPPDRADDMQHVTALFR
jgi:hypothetical protein